MTNRTNETILTDLQSIFTEMGMPKAINVTMSLTSLLLRLTLTVITSSVISHKQERSTL